MFYYDKIGKKIKGLAQALFFLQAIGAIIGGTYLIFSGSNIGIYFGIIIILIVPIIAWIGSWTLYGFGELIDAAVSIKNNTKNTNITLNKLPNPLQDATKFLESKPSVTQVQYTQCPHCGEIVKSSTCDMCGKPNNLFD